ncbi:hypothetical protein A3709_08895 [Halioglobus sp. HI00S01]|uniref:DUF885 domain-containing protein n=1 Tax=Halioglobus sp. HI00S01 TaxID=1822214 RepID=UPI0007C20C9A|nr:DUF885 domain-containing protein [Halioglobus sp. HI00S01]KZX55096.1 hypothetical protein A3709_08895 [Halioglobus sp. HI00S01]
MREIMLLICLAASLHVHAGASDTLDTLIEEHWAWYLNQFPESRTYRGDHSQNDRWTDQSAPAIAARLKERKRFLADLQEIDRGTLDAEAQLNYDLFERMLKLRIERQQHGLHLMSMNMRNGPHTAYTISAYTRFSTAEDYRMWLSRLTAMPDYLKRQQALLDEGIASGRVQPRVVIQRIPTQIGKMLDSDVTANPFYGPLLNMPETIDSAEAELLQAEARDIIKTRVNPAYKKFAAYLEDTYLPVSNSAPGIGSLEGGKAVYEYLARQFTTTDLTPAEIHEIGKQEVTRILAEMEEVRKEVEFDGDLQAFNEFLRTDPQFYYETPEELYHAYLAISKRLDPELVQLFGKLPRMPYGVTPIPDQIAPNTTTAYYMPPANNGTRAGYYYVNLYRPDVRPKYEMEVLSVHEAVPGHHLQIALAQELEGLPPFRTESRVTAFTEGWGLYSERLGYQMGLYQDPYSRYGQLVYDMWRAVRLVVDTGIHYFGWSREQAIEYFKANAAKTEADIINEIDRYIGWPGQALAYKIGQLKILELRAEAETALDDNFDIRRFHDELLGAGAIPLDALERRMDAWLEAERAASTN